MAVDLSQPLVDSEGNRIEKVGGLWTYFTKDGTPATSEAMAPKPSLVDMVRACRFRMGFYEFFCELHNWQLTIQDCYRENARATIQALNDSFYAMMWFCADLRSKSQQSRDHIAKIGDCEDLDPKVRKILDNFLFIWDNLNIETSKVA